MTNEQATTMKQLLLLCFVTLMYGAQAQQTINSEPSVYYYTFKIADIGTWSDDGSVKVVQTYLKPLFDVIVPMNDQGEFKISTSFIVDEEKTRVVLQDSGFELLSFDRRTQETIDSFTE